MNSKDARPLTKSELRAVADRLARQRFGVPASRLRGEVTSGSTGDSAAARRLAFMADYAKK